MRQLLLPDRRPKSESDVGGDYREEIELEAQYDILYFIECLGKDRNKRFADCGRPDIENRNEPSPDRLVTDVTTGKNLVIEYSQLRIAVEMPRIRHESELYGFAQVPSLAGEELAKKLTDDIEKKREKNQFAQYPNAEKILLLRDWVSPSHRPKDFEECSKYFKLPDNPGCDHCYILLRKDGLVLELF